MTSFEIGALALALSMDAFAVAIATGIHLCTVNTRQYFRLSFHFGLFQFIMPVIGYAAGLTFRSAIETWDHWVAFALLALVGGKMIIDAFADDEEEENATCIDPTKGSRLIVLSVATSIDALAVGLSFAMLQQSIWVPATAIGVICAVVTFAGVYIGKMTSNAMNLGSRAACLGGIVLVAIGVRILFEHGVFAQLLG